MSARGKFCNTDIISIINPIIIITFSNLENLLINKPPYFNSAGRSLHLISRGILGRHFSGLSMEILY